MHSWSPNSWRNFSYQQAAIYPDEKELDLVVKELQALPALVRTTEIQDLKKAVAAAGRGFAFIVQGGDCAESFKDCQPEIIRNKLKILLQMGLVLSRGLQKPIIKVGRIAGQYAKPRSAQYETIDGITLPSYRGDLINLPQFDAKSREPDPKRMLEAYASSAKTLRIIQQLQRDENYLGNETFYTSHEALHLHYEQALTQLEPDGSYYDLSTHLPWIGLRTAKPNSAHLEFIRGISNPVGIKVGPCTSLANLVAMIENLNPEREEGRLLLITRFGAGKIADLLPPMIKAVQATQIPITWSCDPMHGNTEITENGTKTRHCDTILSELQQAVRIHRRLSSHLGGVHLELTGDDVTECVGGARNLLEADLDRAYHSLVDPRLNYEQSLEMALELSREFK